MTEDDTFDALRRVPIQELEAQNEWLTHLICRNEWLRIVEEIWSKHENEGQFAKKITKWTFGIFSTDPVFYLKMPLPDPLFEDMAFKSFQSGWTYKEYIRIRCGDYSKTLQSIHDSFVKRNKRINRLTFILYSLLMSSIIILATSFGAAIFGCVGFSLLSFIVFYHVKDKLNSESYRARKHPLG